MTVRVSRSGAVDCRANLRVPLSAASAWGQLRDFHTYAKQDGFHQHIVIEGGVPRPGAQLQIVHRRAGITIRRQGRVLVWREGVGFSFSDLSRRGPRRGFPHIFSLRLAGVSASACDLSIAVRGRWTARRVPHWIAGLWLGWVFADVVRNTENKLLTYALWRRGHLERRQPKQA